jgi:magnesium chelatase family protein
MLARTLGLGLEGIRALPVEVEVSTGGGLPTFSMVGLPDSAVKESRQRVTAAVANIGLALPKKKITVNLAPAYRRKEGSGLDLPIALCLLAAAGSIPPGELEGRIFLGELALDGGLRPVRGVLPMAAGAAGMDHRGLFVPAGCAGEAALARPDPLYAAATLADVVAHLRGEAALPSPAEPGIDGPGHGADADLDDVRGQEQAKRAMELAAAGGHNVLMIGPPGSGKTMLARRLPTILPPMGRGEAIETTMVHSVAGTLPEGRPLVSHRPFRCPHHTVSDAGLIGGGSTPRPGEASLAHNGVLFLDELPEFRRSSLEVLRQPMEDGRVTIARAAMTVSYPARFMLAAAMNPCPCGWATHPKRSCNCTYGEVRRYLGRVSGPLLDRVDIHVEVAPVEYSQLASPAAGGGASEDARKRVVAARKRQTARFCGMPGVRCNADMPAAAVEEHCPLDSESRSLLRRAMDGYGLSARAYHRVLRIARTAADLEGAGRIGPAHLSEAVACRTLDRDLWGG